MSDQPPSSSINDYSDKDLLTIFGGLTFSELWFIHQVHPQWSRVQQLALRDRTELTLLLHYGASVQAKNMITMSPLAVQLEEYFRGEDGRRSVPYPMASALSFGALNPEIVDNLAYYLPSITLLQVSVHSEGLPWSQRQIQLLIWVVRRWAPQLTKLKLCIRAGYDIDEQGRKIDLLGELWSVIGSELPKLKHLSLDISQMLFTRSDELFDDHKWSLLNQNAEFNRQKIAISLNLAKLNELERFEFASATNSTTIWPMLCVIDVQSSQGLRVVDFAEPFDVDAQERLERTQQLMQEGDIELIAVQLLQDFKQKFQQITASNVANVEALTQFVQQFPNLRKLTIEVAMPGLSESRLVQAVHGLKLNHLIDLRLLLGVELPMRKPFGTILDDQSTRSRSILPNIKTLTLEELEPVSHEDAFNLFALSMVFPNLQGLTIRFGRFIGCRNCANIFKSYDIAQRHFAVIFAQSNVWQCPRLQRIRVVESGMYTNVYEFGRDSEMSAIEQFRSASSK